MNNSEIHGHYRENGVAVSANQAAMLNTFGEHSSFLDQSINNSGVIGNDIREINNIKLQGQGPPPKRELAFNRQN